MEGIKEAFDRVKNDIDSLRLESNFLKENILETKKRAIEICDIFKIFNEKIAKLEDQNIFFKQEISNLKDLLGEKSLKNANLDKSLDRNKFNETQIKTDFFDFYLNSTDISTGNEGVYLNSTDISTIKSVFKPLNDNIYKISTGNKGVQTDKQTNNQTDKNTINSSYNQNNLNKKDLGDDFNLTQDSLDSALNIIDSLDSLKKEIRLKFKRLTEQELLVFSTIYQLEEEFGYSDYKSIAKKLSLTESSIRDYVRRLIAKGVPIDKNKINNKEIKILISPNLKRVASLNTILNLRDL